PIPPDLSPARQAENTEDRTVPTEPANVHGQ
ncbi:MAG: hypothetical protein QOI50_1933, partial [Pseudonocardiales bacterium]|nr:hypothetical protein [Pseudonocardiales bacterium]